jgi:diacylglycerol kinase family enzyme
MAALASLTAATVLTLLGIVAHLADTVFALISVLMCITASWYLVSRRGVIQIAALVVVAASLAALLAGLLLAGLSIWRLAVIAVLLPVSAVSARHALRKTPKALHSAASHRRRAGRAGHPVLIMNLKSGGGKAERFRLAQECRERGIETVILRPGDDLRGLAEDAIARGADAIGMAGGDGSQALVAAAAARHGVPYVCVPAGTRNHFALDLGLDRADVIGALDAFTDGVEQQVDLGAVNGRTFVNNASLGVYAKVVQAPGYRVAKLKTAMSMLPDLVGPDASPMDLRFTGPDGQQHPTAHMILVSNNPYQLAHAGGRGTRERMDRGLLGIVAVRIADAPDAGRFVALELAGQLGQFHGWLEWTASRFEVGSAGPVEVGIDGEALVMDPPVVFESRPGALRVLLPRQALRHSPAARAVRLMSRSTAVDLGRVAVGLPAVHS